MRRTLKFLAVASAIVMPAAAQAQACTSAQLAANPLVALGFRAFGRINGTAFDLSCYYQNLGSNQVGFASSATISIGSGASMVTGTVQQAVFTTSGPTTAFDYLLASTMPGTGPTAADFAYVFVSPLTSAYYTDATSTVTVNRVSGNPSVRLVPPSSSASTILAGVPSYVRANNSFYAYAAGGNAANPFATPVISAGSTPCTSANGASCTYTAVPTSPDAFFSAWGNQISYRHDRRASSVTLSGEATITATPEPATVALMASGLIALVGAGYARRREQA